MKLKTHPHKSDILTFTKDDLHRLANGETLQAGALTIEMEKEPKPDRVVYPKFAFDEENRSQHLVAGKLKLVFDGESGKLKSAEVV